MDFRDMRDGFKYVKIGDVEVRFDHATYYQISGTVHFYILGRYVGMMSGDTATVFIEKSQEFGILEIR